MYYKLFNPPPPKKKITKMTQQSLITPPVLWSRPLESSTRDESKNQKHAGKLPPVRHQSRPMIESECLLSKSNELLIVRYFMSLPIFVLPD